MWKLIKRLNRYRWFYKSFGEKYINKRTQAISKMTDQERLYKIVLTEQAGWIKALDRITDSTICERIYRSAELQPRFREYGNYFEIRAKLIDNINDKLVQQKLYAEAIEQAVEAIKNEYRRYSNIIADQGFVTESNMLKRIKRIVDYIRKIENEEQQNYFLLLVADICDNAPTSVLVPTSYINGRLVQPKNETKEFGREIRSWFEQI